MENYKKKKQSQKEIKDLACEISNLSTFSKKFFPIILSYDVLMERGWGGLEFCHVPGDNTGRF